MRSKKAKEQRFDGGRLRVRRKTSMPEASMAGNDELHHVSNGRTASASDGTSAHDDPSGMPGGMGGGPDSGAGDDMPAADGGDMSAGGGGGVGDWRSAPIPNLRNDGCAPPAAVAATGIRAGSSHHRDPCAHL